MLHCMTSQPALKPYTGNDNTGVATLFAIAALVTGKRLT